MAGFLVVLFPEIVVVSAVILGVILLFALLHMRSLVRNIFGAAALLFTWALRAGSIGFAVFLAAWVFMFPVMAAVCTAVGLARTWLDWRFRREAKRQARLAAQRL
jgi:hypothetical protein